MITSIKIQNYQSHSNTVLEFNPGVNVIVGASDSGKSGILRALHWAWRNKPSGDSMKSHWGGETKVEVHTDTDTIIRTKGTKDTYNLNGVSFTAFGQKVPTEIENAWNMEDVNFHSQFSGAFLLADSYSPGSVARYFNKIVHLEKIDQTTKRINADISKEDSFIQNKMDIVEASEKQIEKFAYLPKLEADIEVLEDFEKRLNKTYGSIKTLESLCARISTIQDTLDKTSPILQAEKNVQEALELLQKKTACLPSINKLERIIKNLGDIDNKLSIYETTVSVEALVTEGMVLVERKNAVESKHKKLTSLVRSISQKSNELDEQKRTFASLHSSFITQFPAVCPLCGNKTTNK